MRETESGDFAFDDRLEAEVWAADAAKHEAEDPGFSREEEREALYETLNQKVETVLRLEDALESLESPNEVPKALADARTDIHSRLTPDIADGVQKLHSLHATVDRWTPDDEQEFLNLNFNDEVRFTFEVDGILADLERKNDLLQSLDSDEKILRVAEKRMNASVDRSGVVDVRRSPLDAVVVLRSDAFRRLHELPGSAGFHALGMPINFVKESQNPLEVTRIVNHERIHNFLEGSATLADRVGEQSKEDLKRMLTWIQESTKGGRTTESPSFVRSMITGRRVLDDFQNEFLAELKNRELKGFGSSAQEQSGEHSVDRFIHHAELHSTAGAHAYDAIRRTLDFGKESTDPRVQGRTFLLAKNLEEGFNRMMDTASRTLYIGKEIDRSNPDADADRRVHALLHILPPTKYRHIERYLRHRYGNETVERVLKQAAE